MLLKRIPRKFILLMAGDFFFITLAYLLSRFIFFGADTWGAKEPIFYEAIRLSMYLYVFYIFDLYVFDIRFINPKYIFRFLLAVTVAPIVVIVATFLSLPSLMPGRNMFLTDAVLVCALTYLWRLSFTRYIRAVPERQNRILIVGAGKSGKALYAAIKDDLRYKVIGFVDDDPAKQVTVNSPEVIGRCDVMKTMIAENDMDTVVLAVTHSKGTELLRNALAAKLSGIDVYDVPSFYEEVSGQVPVEHLDDLWLVSMPLLGLRKKNIYNSKVKRITDVMLAVTGIVLSIPIIVLTAIAVKLESTGPVFYLQKRIGLNGKPFDLIKFRSMTAGTEHDRCFAGDKGDPRITKIGRIIRYSRIDEIPQMWNVIKGEMSFIGPRALMAEEVREFEGKVPYFSLRHSIRPGVTGWAQVNYRHGASVEDAIEKLKYDIFYIKNLSPFIDFHILLKTVKVVLWGKGAR